MNEIITLFTSNSLGVFGIVVAVLLGLFGIQSSRLKKSKRQTEEEKAHAEYEKKLREQQQKVVKDAEDVKEEFSDTTDEVVKNVAPEITKAKDIPHEDKKELGDSVKEMAKAQADRIAKRRAKK